MMNGEGQGMSGEGLYQNTESGHDGVTGEAADDRAFDYWREDASGEQKVSQQEQKENASNDQAYTLEVGDDLAFDEAVLASYAQVARELNMPKEQAQQVVDKMIPAMQARQEELMAEVRQGWHDASTADREFGGARLHENLAIAKRAMDAFGTPELKALLDESGLGNHPEIIRAFYRAGKTISEDTIVSGQASDAGRSQPIEKRLYPNM